MFLRVTSWSCTLGLSTDIFLKKFVNYTSELLIFEAPTKTYSYVENNQYLPIYVTNHIIYSGRD